jgi:hypothetical protein
MSLFNEKLKHITLKEVLSLIIILFLIQFFLNSLNIIQMDSMWIYLLVILYFIFRLRDNLPDKNDYMNVFEKSTLKYVFLVVILNIFISYGFLYLSDFISPIFPSFAVLPAGHVTSNSILTLSLIATIFVSPIAEELIFRGVFLNRLKLIVPPIFAVLVSSLLFASLHSYGSIISAFIFALCMAVLYLKTDNILVPIFAHFLNNLIAEVIVFIDRGNVLFTNDAVVIAMSILAIISFVLISNSIIRELNSIK